MVTDEPHVSILIESFLQAKGQHTTSIGVTEAFRWESYYEVNAGSRDAGYEQII